MRNDKWVSIYENFLIKLRETRPTGPYNRLDISKHYTNELVETFGWRYNKHHIEEINTSGAILKTKPEYKTGESIIVDFMEHYLLHYIIVLAGTTSPNHGMVVPMVRGGLNVLDAVMEWDDLVVESCKKYNIEYVPNWTRKLTIMGV